jgi:hypothetical protein
MVTHHHDNYRYFSKVLNMEEQLWTKKNFYKMD